MPQWIIIIPWIWTILIVFIGAYNNSGYKTLEKAFRFGNKEIMGVCIVHLCTIYYLSVGTICKVFINLSITWFILSAYKGLTDALEMSLYIHAASVGTELITGKGLNRYGNHPHLILMQSSSYLLIIVGAHWSEFDQNLFNTVYIFIF